MISINVKSCNGELSTHFSLSKTRAPPKFFSLSFLLHQNSFFVLLSFPLSLFLNRQHHLIPTSFIFSLTKSVPLSLRRNQTLTKVSASVVGKQIRLFSCCGYFDSEMVCFSFLSIFSNLIFRT